jgi:hypothetical protein
MLNRYTLFMVFWAMMGFLLVGVFIAAGIWLGTVYAWFNALICCVGAVYFCWGAVRTCYRKWLFIEYKHSPH